MTAAQFDGQGDEAARNLAEAHERLLTDPSIQFELPTGAGSPGTQTSPQPGYGPPSEPAAAPPAPADPGSPPAQAPELSLPAGGGDGVEGVMQVFLWVAAGLALAILLYWLLAFVRDRVQARNEAGRGTGRRRGREPEEWRPAEAPARQLLDEADQLANQGRYDEAAHLLLHRSIGEIDAHRPDLVRPALTSRDIAGHPALPARPAAAFARIAALVERSLFARRPLGAEDWQDCRAAYREFAFAEAWQG